MILSESGVRWRGLIAREGEIPPVSGPIRNDYCMEAGLDALTVARRSYGQALIEVSGVRPGALRLLPRPYPLHETHPLWLRHGVGNARRSQWSYARRGLTEQRPSSGRIQSLATSALRSSIDAYNWLDDVVHDLPGDTMVDVGTFASERAGLHLLADLISDSHRLAHAAGELLGGLFGCYYSLGQDGFWYDDCAVRLMHFRMGLSIGFTARYVCSVCGLDAGECLHTPGVHYEVRAPSDDGSPTIVAGYRMKDPVMHETTLTPRPGDPLARITAVSVDRAELAKLIGRPPTSDDRVSSPECLHPCGGFGALDLKNADGVRGAD